MKFLLLFAICFIVGQSFPITLKKSPLKLLASRDGGSITFRLGLPDDIDPTADTPDDFVSISLMDNSFTDFVTFDFYNISLVPDTNTEYKYKITTKGQYNELTYVIRASKIADTDNLWDIKVTYPSGAKHIGKVYLGACPKKESIFSGKNVDNPCSILQLSGYTDGRGLKFSFYFPMTVIMRGSTDDESSTSCHHLCVKGFGNMASGFDQHTYINEEGMGETAFQSLANQDKYCKSYPGTITRSGMCEQNIGNFPSLGLSLTLSNMCTNEYKYTCDLETLDMNINFKQNTVCSNMNAEDKEYIRLKSVNCCDTKGDMCSIYWLNNGYNAPTPFKTIVQTNVNANI